MRPYTVLGYQSYIHRRTTLENHAYLLPTLRCFIIRDMRKNVQMIKCRYSV